MKETKTGTNEANENEAVKKPEKNEQRLYTQEQLDERLEIERKQFAEKLAEAEKLAAMPENDRSDYKRKMLEKELAEREAAVAKRELMADAVEKLESAGLPRQLAVCLDYSGKEQWQLSLETVCRTFQTAVSAAVNERMCGRIPKLSTSGTGSDAFLEGLGL